MPLISRNVPAYASSQYSPAPLADDGSYDTAWRSQGTPGWLAYDLSAVPPAERRTVLVVWYNASYEYDNAVIVADDYNCPKNYTIDVNAAPGGGRPPPGGWVTLVTVRRNTKHSRQHLVDMAGYNWIRVDATAANGATSNYDIAVNMDIYDAGHGVADDWIFFGDSITARAMMQATVGGVPSFAQLIHAALPAHLPLAEDGGIPYLTSGDGARHVPVWLTLFPGTYVGLSYGTNDANGCVPPIAFYKHYVTMVQAVLKAGKVPIIPHIPWARAPHVQRCGPGLNAQIDRLYAAYPRIVRGPDLWTFFQKNQGLISSDHLHPTDQGYGAYRRRWAAQMLASVYK
jgi:lysophospholipase L1-like esterase